MPARACCACGRLLLPRCVCVCVCVGGWQVARFETVARRLGIMDNVKAGVPRVAYHGVVTVRMHGRKVHVSPPIRDIKF